MLPYIPSGALTSAPYSRICMASFVLLPNTDNRRASINCLFEGASLRLSALKIAPLSSKNSDINPVVLQCSKKRRAAKVPVIKFRARIEQNFNNRSVTPCCSLYERGGFPLVGHTDSPIYISAFIQKQLDDLLMTSLGCRFHRVIP